MSDLQAVVVKPEFKALWECNMKVVDDINRRQQGWSQVGKVEFLADSQSISVVPAYLKRQQGYTTRSLLHPIKGIATLRREYRMLISVIKKGVGVAPPLYFEEASAQRAVLVVEALEQHRSLDQLSPGNRIDADQAIDLAAELVARVHRLGICHGCLYPKHLFWLSPEVTGVADMRLIDWEKARYSPRRRYSRVRDLDSLNRHASGWSLRQRYRFLVQYLGKPVGDPEIRVWWQRLCGKLQNKQSR